MDLELLFFLLALGSEITVQYSNSSLFHWIAANVQPWNDHISGKDHGINLSGQT